MIPSKDNLSIICLYTVKWFQVLIYNSQNEVPVV